MCVNEAINIFFSTSHSANYLAITQRVNILRSQHQIAGCKKRENKVTHEATRVLRTWSDSRERRDHSRQREGASRDWRNLRKWSFNYCRRSIKISHWDSFAVPGMQKRSLVPAWSRIDLPPIRAINIQRSSKIVNVQFFFSFVHHLGFTAYMKDTARDDLWIVKVELYNNKNKFGSLVSAHDLSVSACPHNQSASAAIQSGWMKHSPL